jgi:surface antigen
VGSIILDGEPDQGDETIAAFLSDTLARTPDPMMIGQHGVSSSSASILSQFRSSSPIRYACLALLTVALAGCGTTGKSGGGMSLLSGGSSKGASYISALQGGIVGRTGAKLSDSDRARALEAEYRALEDAENGQAVSWKSDDASGEVTANAPYQVGTQNCRQYRHVLKVDGKDFSARGAACRNEDGTWTPLT